MSRDAATRMTLKLHLESRNIIVSCDVAVSRFVMIFPLDLVGNIIDAPIGYIAYTTLTHVLVKRNVSLFP